MNLLPDTHRSIWNDLEPARLSSQVVQELISRYNVLWLSAISILELGVLVEKKRLQLKQQFHVWANDSVKNLELREAPVSWRVA